MKYFLIIRSEWRLFAQDFKNRLLARWPNTRLQEDPNPQSINCMDFEIPMTYSVLEGGMQRDGGCIVFDGDIRDFTQFSLWVRSLVPPTERLFFCDEGMSGSTDLEPTSSPDDIYRLYDYAPPPPGWMNYSLLPLPDWTLPRREFIQRLRARWPEAWVQLEPDAHPHRLLSYRIPMPHSTLTGCLTRSIPSLDFTGDIRDCAEFSLWCRSILPADEFSVSSEKGTMRLQPSTTVEEFIRGLSPLHSRRHPEISWPT